METERTRARGQATTHTLPLSGLHAALAFVSELGKISTMPGITRVTQPTLDVLAVLLEAHQDGSEIYGWEIKKKACRSGPTVYGVMDRLEDADLLEGRWERQTGDDKGPRRRYYRLTDEGVKMARHLLGAHSELPTVEDESSAADHAVSPAHPQLRRVV